jgi:hypothetical protein
MTFVRIVVGAVIGLVGSYFVLAIFVWVMEHPGAFLHNLLAMLLR